MNNLSQTLEPGHRRCGCGNLNLDDPALAVLPAVPLTAAEIADLTAMREEEKVARDVYLRLFDRWGLRPFGKISGSEQSHMDMLLIMLDRHGLPDPVRRLDVGEFNSPQMQKLHDDLLARGLLSETEAVSTGLLIEELDIIDLRQAARRTSRPDLRLVYAKLEQGSRNHLRAFNRWLNGLAGHYDPVHLTRAEYDAIAKAEHEPCG
ncbi:MAG: DUF2202 domain-containing protein [Acidocella sp.]|nr:DUF2202 domain-containing protein [Acidocella sp.]